MRSRSTSSHPRRRHQRRCHCTTGSSPRTSVRVGTIGMPSTFHRIPASCAFLYGPQVLSIACGVDPLDGKQMCLFTMKTSAPIPVSATWANSGYLYAGFKTGWARYQGDFEISGSVTSEISPGKYIKLSVEEMTSGTPFELLVKFNAEIPATSTMQFSPDLDNDVGSDCLTENMLYDIPFAPAGMPSTYSRLLANDVFSTWNSVDVAHLNPAACATLYGPQVLSIACGSDPLDGRQACLFELTTSAPIPVSETFFGGGNLYTGLRLNGSSKYASQTLVDVSGSVSIRNNFYDFIYFPVNEMWEKVEQGLPVHILVKFTGENVDPATTLEFSADYPPNLSNDCLEDRVWFNVPIASSTWSPHPPPPPSPPPTPPPSSLTCVTYDIAEQGDGTCATPHGRIVHKACCGAGNAETGAGQKCTVTMSSNVPIPTSDTLFDQGFIYSSFSTGFNGDDYDFRTGSYTTEGVDPWFRFGKWPSEWASGSETFELTAKFSSPLRKTLYFYPDGAGNMAEDCMGEGRLRRVAMPAHILSPPPAAPPVAGSIAVQFKTVVPPNSMRAESHAHGRELVCFDSDGWTPYKAAEGLPILTKTSLTTAHIHNKDRLVC